MEGGSTAGGRGAGEGVPAADIEGDELREELTDRQLVCATPEGTEHGAHFFVVTNHHLLLIRRYQSRSEPPKKRGLGTWGTLCPRHKTPPPDTLQEVEPNPENKRKIEIFGTNQDQRLKCLKFFGRNINIGSLQSLVWQGASCPFQGMQW